MFRRGHGGGELGRRTIGEVEVDRAARADLDGVDGHGWNKIYAYVYVDNNAAAGNVIQNAAWPGELMTAESGACDGTADQVYEISAC